MEPIVRIIVPMYNCQLWIKDLLDSIVNQTYNNWECVLIDDCSTDSTFNVANNYINQLNEKSNKFIIIKHKENKHVAGARNTGLKDCTTKYVYFCDSDDVLEPTLLERAIKTAEQKQVPLLQFGHQCVRGKSQNAWFRKLFPPENYYSKIDTKWYYCVWNFLFKTDLIKKYNIEFDEQLIQNEDELFLLMYSWYMFKDGYSYYAIPDILYSYRFLNPNSLTTTFNLKDRELYKTKLAQFMQNKKDYGDVLKRMNQILQRLNETPGPVFSYFHDY